MTFPAVLRDTELQGLTGVHGLDHVFIKKRTRCKQELQKVAKWRQTDCACSEKELCSLGCEKMQEANGEGADSYWTEKVSEKGMVLPETETVALFKLLCLFKLQDKR